MNVVQYACYNYIPCCSSFLLTLLSVMLKAVVWVNRRDPVSKYHSTSLLVTFDVCFLNGHLVTARLLASPFETLQSHD